MTIKYTLTAEDSVAMNLHALNTSESSKRQMRFARIALGAVLLIDIVFFGYGVHIKSFNSQLTALAVFAVVGTALITYRAYQGWLVKQMIYKRIETGRASEYEGERVLTITRDKILVEYDGGKNEYDLSRIDRVGSDGERVFIYLGGESTITVPIGALGDESGRRAFANAIGYAE